MAFAQAFIGTLLFGFGLVTASQADPEDRPLVWAMTAIPAAVSAYGILLLTLPEEKASPAASSARPQSTIAWLPPFGFAQLPGGLMLRPAGVF